MSRQTQLLNDRTKQTDSDNYSHELYVQAEKQALWYFCEIDNRQDSDELFIGLGKDILRWQKKADRSNSVSVNQWQSIEDMDSWTFLEKLAAEGELKDYLLKTIRYIYIRDLGMRLDNRRTRKLINETVTKIMSLVRDQDGKQSFTDSTGLIRNWTAKRGLQTTYQWLMLKLSEVEPLFSNDTGRTHGMRKLVKIIAGVVLHHLIIESKNHQELDYEQLDVVIRLGYCYGLTYPFIDDLQDSAIDLNNHDKTLFNEALRQSLQSGHVVDYPIFEQDNERLRHIYRELKWAFEFIQSNLSTNQAENFFKRAYIFFEAQDTDRQRSLKDVKELSMADLYLPVMLKSAGCRLIARDLVAETTDNSFDYRTFCFGIYNQFNDDIKDIFEDIQEDNLTPYSYYLTHGHRLDRKQSPYRYYWAVVHYLINDVYAAEPVTRTLLIERCINAHKSLLQAVGKQRYLELEKSLLTTGEQSFDDLIHRLVFKPADIAWFDKLISQEVAKEFQQRKAKADEFKLIYQEKHRLVESHLQLTPHKKIPDGLLHSAANYALKSGGKRLRPVIAQFMSDALYNFSETQCREVNQLLEYMHTASLILDDLPAQDDAAIRRGKPTVHTKFNSEAMAELSSVYLMMRAVEIQSSIKSHQAEYVLRSLQYAAETTQAICEGQMLDLVSKNRPQTIDDLLKICHLKTGLAIEASFVIPAILAGMDDIHIGQMKQLARFIGLAFQIKDDLLDEIGSETSLGKPVAQDRLHQRATFVSLYGVDEATTQMFENYYHAKEIVAKIPEISDFMSALLDYIVYRNH